MLVSAKMTPPETIAEQHNAWSPNFLITSLKITAKLHAHSKQRKKVCRDAYPANLFRDVATGVVEEAILKSAYTFERTILGTPVGQSRYAKGSAVSAGRFRTTVPHQHQTVWVAERQGPQQHSIHYRKNCGVGPDAQSQRDNCNRCEARLLNQRSCAVAQVLPETLHLQFLPALNAIG